MRTKQKEVAASAHDGTAVGIAMASASPHQMPYHQLSGLLYEIRKGTRMSSASNGVVYHILLSPCFTSVASCVPDLEGFHGFHGVRSIASALPTTCSATRAAT